VVASCLKEKYEMATQLTVADQPQVPQSAEAEKFSLMQRQARLFAQSPLIPAHLRNGSPDQAMANCYIAMTIADRMGEDRMTVMQNIHIVHGTAGFKAQYMIARANASGVFKDGIDWEVTGKGKDLSVTAFATLANTGRRVEITVDMAMADAEGWTKNSKYKTMPEIMLRYRSGTFLVRMYAPQVMLGYQTAEENEDVAFAAIPAAEPLTGQALLEQAKPEDAPANATANFEPENITENMTAQPRTLGEQLGLDDPTPGEAKAAEILAEIGDCISTLDVTALVNRHKDDIAAMPDELGVKIEVAADKRRKAIEAERAKAGAREEA
jgi:hypothetical protein